MYESIMLGFITMAFFAVSMGFLASMLYGIWIDRQEFDMYQEGFRRDPNQPEEEPEDPPIGR